MTAISNRLRERKKAQAEIDHLWSQSGSVKIIHYSCESFYDRKNGTSPRITSIAVRDLNSGQTHSFSIHLQAEKDGIVIDKIPEMYNDLEKKMLDEFFNYIKNNKSVHWIHWNMRDINYGFAAIEHRYTILGGNPEIVSDSLKHDLALLLLDIYGPNYIEHPRLPKLRDKNRISTKDFLTGAEEAAAFETRDYVKLHLSTLRKVESLTEILAREWKGLLKTNATRAEIYGSSFGGFIESLTDNWVYKLAGFIGLVASLIEFFALFKK